MHSHCFYVTVQIQLYFNTGMQLDFCRYTLIWNLLVIKYDWIVRILLSVVQAFLFSTESHEGYVQLENNADKSQWTCKAKQLVIRI